MDFHSLTRRELQSLCKKNKIPANLTNVAMADSLKALEIVEGIEELMNPSESVTAQSSIESPEKLEVTSPCVPRTGGRTTRRKTVETSQTLTRTRRSTRKLVAGEVETPAATNTRRVQVASVRRKMDTQLKEVEEDQKIGKKISETPGVLAGSRPRGLKGESTVGVTARRSTRLAEKIFRNSNIKENETLETIKGELFLEESGENLEMLEMNVKEWSHDLGEIIEAADVDLKEQVEEVSLNRNINKEVNSDKKSDYLIENEIQSESNEDFVAVGSDMIKEEDILEGHGCDVEDKVAADFKAEVHSEICEETYPSTDITDKPLEMADEIEEKTGGDQWSVAKTEDLLENVGGKLEANKEEMVSQNIATETVEKEVAAQYDELTIANEALEKNEETMDFIEDGDSELYDDLFVTEKVVVTANSQNNMELKDGSADEVVENANGESDIEFKDLSADEIEEANKYAEDLAAFGNIDGALEKEPEEQGVDIVTALESMKLEKTDSLAEESIENNVMKETVALELNASTDVLSEIKPKYGFDGPVSYNVLPVPTAADDMEQIPVTNFPAETELSQTVLSTCLTPSKKLATSKTPTKKSAIKKTPTSMKKLNHVFDDKENIDNNSGKKLIQTIEKKKIKELVVGQPTKYADYSLRQLKKVLKETEMSRNLKKDEQQLISSSRPALQAVSDNIVGE